MTEKVTQSQLNELHKRIRMDLGELKNKYDMILVDNERNGKAINDAYEKGMNDFRDILLKICAYSMDEKVDAFGCAFMDDILSTYEPDDIIAAWQEYEKDKIEREAAESDIQVFDEVSLKNSNSDTKYIVVDITSDDGCTDSYYVVNMTTPVYIDRYCKEDLKKTGKHYKLFLDEVIE